MDIKINKTPPATRSYPRHSHKRYEIMHYISGRGVMKTETADIPFSEGTSIVMPKGVAHGSVSDGEFVNISIESDFGGVIVLTEPVSIDGTPDDDGAALVSMIWENRFGSETYLNSLCIAYAQYLVQKVSIEGNMPRRISAIVKSISERALDPQTDLCAILRESGYAEDYVRACFKRIIGKTPTEFLTELRINHACYLIDIYGGTVCLSEIARMCGYDDYVYFSKRFKKLIGMSPESYRKI